MTHKLHAHRKGLILAATALFLAAQPALAARKVLRLVFDGPMLEAPDETASMMALLGGESAKTLHEWVRMIERAADDDEIAGLAMVIEQPRMGFAQLEEITRALKQFRSQGKKVYCYVDYGGNGTYALACAADHITLAENSLLGISGLYAELSYYKNLLTKIGVEAQILHCGDYKSAGEPFYRTEPSEEAAENVNWLLDGIYDRWIELMAEGRGLTTEQMQGLVDQAPLRGEDALEHKLIDEIGSFSAFRQRIHKEFGQDVEVVKKYKKSRGLDIDFENPNPFQIFQLFRELFETAQAEPQPGIALVYIEGAIVTGKSESGPFGGGGMAGSTTIRSALIKAREDDNIKAVVVRVDSPGGSALASDIIWKAATRCAEEKPLIVSMGNVAGSGGYYVSIPGDTIFAEAGTITASIGVVGGKFIWRELMEDKLGITTTEFKRGEYADLFNMNRPWDEDEKSRVEEYLNDTYAQFKERIKSSRGDRIKGELEDMAGGRVFTGRQALERGLVDRIGGLSDAIELAARKVGLDDYEIYVLPEEKDIFQKLLAELTGQEQEDEWEISVPNLSTRDNATAARLRSNPLLRAALPLLQELAPQRMHGIAQGLNALMILHEERVGCFMPFDITLR